MSSKFFLGLAAVALVSACADGSRTLGPNATDAASFALAGLGQPGNVFIQTNSAAGNAVLAFRRGADGSLSGPVSYPTGGTGTGAGLGNQGALAVDGDHAHLFVVNAGSNGISAFGVAGSVLTLRATTPSQGIRPVSLTVHGDLLYVLNAGGDGDIAGFRVNDDGTLSPLPGSVRPLSAPGAGGAEVSFDDEGTALVVTEKATGRILTYPVRADGTPGDATITTSSGATPFGFGITHRGDVIVSEAGPGAVSSYRLAGSALSLVSASVSTTQAAACWIAVTGNNRFAYTTNAASGTITGFAIGNDGSLTRLNGDGITARTTGGPTDLVVTGKFLYANSVGRGTIDAFVVGTDGSLTAISGAAGLPAGFNGIAGY